jgi:hypothetical protein
MASKSPQTGGVQRGADPSGIIFIIIFPFQAGRG